MAEHAESSELQAAAEVCLTSLCEHRDFTTPQSIAGSPFLEQKLSQQEIQEGLFELERQGLATGENGIWRLTEAGEERCQQGEASSRESYS